MANFHPDDNLLLEYANGTIDWALGICISAHLSFCPHCRNKVAELNALGGVLLSQDHAQENSFECTTANTVDSAAFSKIMGKIHNLQEAPEKEKIASVYSSNITSTLPPVVRKLLPTKKKLKWRYLSPALREAHLSTEQDKYQVSFHKIKRGGKVTEHDHKGLEVTLVLEGMFSDEGGAYGPGDFLVKEPGQVHRPMATQEQDCLCLSIQEAPVKITGVMGKIINPFLSLSPG